MDILMWGSRSLTPRHLHVFDDLRRHSTLRDDVDLANFLKAWHASGQAERDAAPKVDSTEMTETPRLINGDGPPGSSTPGAIGADKLALLSCFHHVHGWGSPVHEWGKPTVRWFRVEPKPGESWGAAAARRDIAMAEARPHRAYCIHTNLDASKGSIITARALERLGIGYWYVRVSTSGKIESIERRGV